MKCLKPPRFFLLSLSLALVSSLIFSYGNKNIAEMAPKVKGLFKKIKCISKIFVYKEPDLEIGYPSDVRHVTHIGWDSASSNAPSWMSQFKSSSDISCEMIEFGPSLQNSWASPDFQRNRGGQFLSSGNGNGCFVPDIPKASKKAKQSKVESPSPAKSRSSSKASFSTAFDESDEFSNYMTGKELDDDILNQQTAIC